MDRKWWTLIAVCIGTFMLLIDVTIVNVALPDIQTSLKSSFSDLQWVVDAYSLMLAAFLLTTGSLADLFGRRRVFAIGLCIFTASSLLSGLATTPLFLNLARGAQGVGGAAMFSTSLALLASSFRGRERGMAFGVWGTITGLAVAIGPVVGGALTTGFGWRWIFLINVPIGVLGVIVTLLRVEESRQPGARRPDWLGALTFSGALAALVYALIQGENKGWTSNEILGCLVGAGILLLAFLIVELVQAAPMFDLSLFRNPTFAGGSIVAFSLSAGMFALLLYLTLYLQDVLGFSALETGKRLLFLSGGILLTSTLAGRLTTRVPIRFLIGPGLILVGVGLMLMRGLDPTSGWEHLIPGFIVGGAGVGLINPPLASTAVGVVEPARAGMASGINSTFRQVGIATGIAGLGAIFSHSVRVKIVGLLAVNGIVAPAQAHVIASGVAQGSGVAAAVASAPAAAHQAVILAVRTSFVDGLNQIFLIAAVLSFAAALLSLVLIRNKDFEASAAYRGAGEAPAGQPAAEAGGIEAQPPDATHDPQPTVSALAGQPTAGSLDESGAPDGAEDLTAAAAGAAGGLDELAVDGSLPPASPPASDAPVSDAPVSDAPVSGAPVSDAPVSDAPDAPVSDAPPPPPAPAPASDAPLPGTPAPEPVSSALPAAPAPEPMSDAPTPGPALDAPLPTAPAPEPLSDPTTRPAPAPDAPLPVASVPDPGSSAPSPSVPVSDASLLPVAPVPEPVPNAPSQSPSVPVSDASVPVVPVPGPPAVPEPGRATASPLNGAPAYARGGNGRAADQRAADASAAALAERSYAVALAAEQAQADCSSYIEQILARRHGRGGVEPVVADDAAARAGALRDRLNHLGDERRRLVGTLREHTQAVSEHLRAAREQADLSERSVEDAANSRRELYGLIAALATLTDEARLEATAAAAAPGEPLQAGGTDGWPTD
jgi:EmrB/QacA subfamily drug resistance transporter